MGVPFTSSLLTVSGESQVDAAMARIEPAARDDLAASEEVNALGAVSMRVTEE